MTYNHVGSNWMQRAQTEKRGNNLKRPISRSRCQQSQGKLDAGPIWRDFKKRKIQGDFIVTHRALHGLFGVDIVFLFKLNTNNH